jgi:curved DNA-binding protein CbpA
MSLHPYDPEFDLYSLLDVSPSAAADEVKRAFYRAIRKVHPDLNSSEAASTAETQRINTAKILLNIELRAEYDRLREEYWAVRRERPSRPRRPAKPRRRAPPREAPKASRSSADEVWEHLAMAFLNGLMRER